MNNTGQITQLARWGKGTISSTAWSPDGKTLAVGTYLGVYLYDAQTDEYCHLVAIDFNGKFAGYCEFSICQEEWRRCGPRLGWIDYIGTAEEQRGQGLGRALLLASLAHLQEWGAEEASLVTVSDNHPALGLYQAAGFLPLEAMTTPGYEMLVSRGQNTSVDLSFTDEA